MAFESIFHDDQTQATPEVVFQNPSFAALTKAFTEALQEFLRHVDMTDLDELRMKARIPNLPEDRLNHLGLLDFRAVGFDTAMNADLRRRLVMSACDDNAHLGTPASVEKLVNLVFGHAIVEENWQYGGAPFRFRIRTTDPVIDPARVHILNQAILATKPISRWPDPVARTRDTGDDILYVGAALFRVRVRRVGRADAG
jgi:Phage tail protein (Tail_P2_I)